MAFHAFVVAMGLGTVFFGLICIVAIIYVTGRVVRRFEKPAPAAVPLSPATPAQDDSELVAVITAALAQDLGKDPSQIVIRSVTSVS